MPNELVLKVYTNRMKHADAYRLQWVEDGWVISHVAYSGKSDKEGKPMLYTILAHDLVTYPHRLPLDMEILWEKVQDQDPGVQKHLNDMARRIKKAELSQADEQS